jgi:tetratricopeptide (TPR) repeat protein
VTALEFNSRLACLQGDWSSGRILVERGVALAPRDANGLVDATDLEYQTGNFSQGEAYLERLLEAMAHTPPGPRGGYARTAMEIPLVARITGGLERLNLATEASQVVLTSPTLTPLYEVLARCGLGIQAIIDDRAQEAGEQYAALQNIQGILVPFQISGDRILGLLAHVMGNLSQAAAHFEDSLAFCRKAGYRPELAWTCCDYADTLLQRNEPGDREKAMSLLDESLAISSELGMRPLMERVLSRREILKA